MSGIGGFVQRTREKDPTASTTVRTSNPIEETRSVIFESALFLEDELLDQVVKPLPFGWSNFDIHHCGCRGTSGLSDFLLSEDVLRLLLTRFDETQLSEAAFDDFFDHKAFLVFRVDTDLTIPVILRSNRPVVVGNNQIYVRLGFV